MGIYQDAIHLLLTDPSTRTWPQLRQTIEQAAHREPVAWDFPIRACIAVGADPIWALPAVAAITCAHMALILIDDLLDEDPRGAYLQLGSGRAANLSTGLYALGISVLFQTKAYSQRELAAAALNEMMGQTAYGQDLDVQNPLSEEGYWAVTQAKSSPYFGGGLYIGALLGQANQETAQQLKRFGGIFGEIMQIHDDLNDCLASPANVDWLQGRSPLPILFAELVDHPDRQRFRDLRSKAAEPEALAEAQAILVRSGAISYCISELIARRLNATELLRTLDLPNPKPLEELLDQALAPVKHLFASVGAKFTDADLDGQDRAPAGTG